MPKLDLRAERDAFQVVLSDMQTRLVAAAAPEEKGGVQGYFEAIHDLLENAPVVVG